MIKIYREKAIREVLPIITMKVQDLIEKIQTKGYVRKEAYKIVRTSNYPELKQADIWIQMDADLSIPGNYLLLVGVLWPSGYTTTCMPICGKLDLIHKFVSDREKLEASVEKILVRIYDEYA